MRRYYSLYFAGPYPKVRAYTSQAKRAEGIEITRWREAEDPQGNDEIPVIASEARKHENFSHARNHPYF